MRFFYLWHFYTQIYHIFYVKIPYLLLNGLNLMVFYPVCDNNLKNAKRKSRIFVLLRRIPVIYFKYVDFAQFSSNTGGRRSMKPKSRVRTRIYGLLFIFTKRYNSHVTLMYQNFREKFPDFICYYDKYRKKVKKYFVCQIRERRMRTL